MGAARTRSARHRAVVGVVFSMRCPASRSPAEAEAELLEALDVLVGLRADEEMLAACILYTLQQAGVAMPAARAHRRRSAPARSDRRPARRRESVVAVRDARRARERGRSAPSAARDHPRSARGVHPARAAARRVAPRGESLAGSPARSRPAQRRHPRAVGQPPRHLAVEVGTRRPRVPLPATGCLPPHRHAARRTPRSAHALHQRRDRAS